MQKPEVDPVFQLFAFCGGYPVEPVDVHASIRHLEVVYDKLTVCDKAMHAYSLGKERVEDVMEMVRIAVGLSDAEFEATPRMYTNANSTSPLKHDHPMIDGCHRLAARASDCGDAVYIGRCRGPCDSSRCGSPIRAEALCAIACSNTCGPVRPA